MGPDWPQEAHFPAHSAPRQDLDSFAASKALLSSESFLTHSLSSLIPVDCRTSPLARALLQLGLPLILSYFLLFHFGVTILESLLRLAEKGPSWPAAIIVYSVLSPRYRERCPKWWLFFSFLFCSVLRARSWMNFAAVSLWKLASVSSFILVVASKALSYLELFCLPSQNCSFSLFLYSPFLCCVATNESHPAVVPKVNLKYKTRRRAS